jgi:hypothetical protein
MAKTRDDEPVRYSITWAYDLAHEEDDLRTRARKVERTWRGEITPERIAADQGAAQVEHVARQFADGAAVATVVSRFTRLHITREGDGFRVGNLRFRTIAGAIGV